MLSVRKASKARAEQGSAAGIRCALATLLEKMSGEDFTAPGDRLTEATPLCFHSAFILIAFERIPLPPCDNVSVSHPFAVASAERNDSSMDVPSMFTVARTGDYTK